MLDSRDVHSVDDIIALAARDQHMPFFPSKSPDETNVPGKSCETSKERDLLTTHSTHFIYGYMVKDHSDSERGYPLPLLFPISSKSSFYRIAHNTAFVTPIVEHCLEREIARWVHHEGSI